MNLPAQPKVLASFMKQCLVVVKLLQPALLHPNCMPTCWGVAQICLDMLNLRSLSPARKSFCPLHPAAALARPTKQQPIGLILSSKLWSSMDPPHGRLKLQLWLLGLKASAQPLLKMAKSSRPKCPTCSLQRKKLPKARAKGRAKAMPRARQLLPLAWRDLLLQLLSLAILLQMDILLKSHSPWKYLVLILEPFFSIPTVHFSCMATSGFGVEIQQDVLQDRLCCH